MCPKGDDRLTPHTGHRTITITINSQSRLNRLSGEFHFQFNGESFLFPTLRTSFSAAKCKAAFEALRNVKEVTCSVTGTDYESVYTVSFLKFPVLPYENNIFAHDGNPPLSAFSCNIDRVVKFRASDALVCRIGELNTDKTYPGESFFHVFLLCIRKSTEFSCQLRFSYGVCEYYFFRCLYL